MGSKRVGCDLATEQGCVELTTVMAYGAACGLTQLLRAQHFVTSHVKASPAYNAFMSNVDDTDDGA